MSSTSPEYPPELAVGVTSERIRHVSPAARLVHRAVLRGFAGTGRAPDRSTLTRLVPPDEQLDQLLAELHAHDVVRLDERGQVRAAYPFSAIPTPTASPCTGPAAERCCTVMNFFTDPHRAAAWQAANPGVNGQVLPQEQALSLGVDIFGRLLKDDRGPADLEARP